MSDRQRATPSTYRCLCSTMRPSSPYRLDELKATSPTTPSRRDRPAWEHEYPPAPLAIKVRRQWYISIVSIIFDCFMPILYNFHIFLATFYMIYWTNLLIQCLVPVPVCCMFFVSLNLHIKQSPNAIKIYRKLFWNISDFWDLESTQTGAHSPQDTPGRAPGARHVVVGCAHLVRRLELYFRHKEAYIRKKSC